MTVIWEGWSFKGVYKDRRVLEPAVKVLEPAVKALELAGRALELAERAQELAGRALEPTGRPPYGATAQKREIVKNVRRKSC